MTSLLVVRAEVSENDRNAFNKWYESEHLREAHKAFKSQKAWRGWCDQDPSLHFAFYQFPDVATVRGVLASDKLQTLIVEFDRIWGDRVKRTRECIDINQSM